jgi:hypothetical protein
MCFLSFFTSYLTKTAKKFRYITHFIKRLFTEVKPFKFVFFSIIITFHFFLLLYIKMCYIDED